MKILLINYLFNFSDLIKEDIKIDFGIQLNNKNPLKDDKLNGEQIFPNDRLGRGRGWSDFISFKVNFIILFLYNILMLILFYFLTYRSFSNKVFMTKKMIPSI